MSFVDELSEYRKLLVEQRRELVKQGLETRVSARGTPYEGAQNPSIRDAEEFSVIQQQIEFIDRAIADEKSMEPSRYEKGGLAGFAGSD